MNAKLIMLSTYVALLLIGCTKENDTNTTPDQGTPSQLPHTLGGLGTDNFNEVPVSTKFGYGSADNLPAAVDLTPYLPPVGDQGSYGTCVSWATGYYAKTAIEGVAKGYTASQLSNAIYQISPLDLFSAVASDQKGVNCGGSTLAGNLDVMQQRGVATLAVAPYSNVSDCSRTSASWDTEAGKHKIKSYRTVEGSVMAIKQQLASKLPVMIIARLSDNFMSWNSDNVLSSNTTYTGVGQHAYHGLSIVGYDDKKGAGGAFRVVNSWGTGWGSKGFIWVDYNFLLNSFVDSDDQGNKALLVMSENTTKPQDETKPTPQPTPATNGVDLVAWVNEDVSAYQTTGFSTARTVDFNIYNDGDADATPKTPWTAYYIYYNARNANDYGILFHHTYTTQNLSTGKYTCDGGNCNLNLPLPAGSNLSKQLFGNDEGVRIGYSMPSSLNGSYYLVLVVDADGTFAEDDEEDNFFYTTDRPIKFRNGYGARMAAGAETAFTFKNPTTIQGSEKLRRSFTSAIQPDNPNAYSPQEISGFIRQQKKSGAFAQKLRDHEQQNSAQSIQSAK